MPGSGFLEAVLFASDVASDPSGVVTLWKAASGGKVAGCLPATPVPELLHAAGLLPISLESPEDLSLLTRQVDAWLVGADPAPIPVPQGGIPRFAFPGVPPGNVEEALDRVEELVEWTRAVSGFTASEGGLWKSIRAHAIRRSLLDAFREWRARESALLTPDERRDIVRAGIFLPPEAHSRLLSTILGIDHEIAAFAEEGEKGDPLIVLARRLI